MSDLGKVVVTEIEGWEKDYLAAQPATARWDVAYYAETVAGVGSADREQMGVLSCFIRSQVDREFLDQCPKLRFIATRSTGYDHIDMQACAERGIVVSNVPVYGENTVAEHTFGLILALSRNVYAAVDRMKRGDMSIEGLLGFDLYGKTLGVVGAGKIGLHVIRIGRAMNMRVLAFDTKPQGILAEVLGFEYCSLEDLLRQADVVSLHVPLNPHTLHLLNDERLGMMKPGAILVNTSRGAVVDSSALLTMLNDGRLAGAALDVLEGEQVISEDFILSHGIGEGDLDKLRLAVEAYQLMHHPKVLVTPHIAFYSREALQRILRTTVENVVGFEGGAAMNVAV